MCCLGKQSCETVMAAPEQLWCRESIRVPVSCSPTCDARQFVRLVARMQRKQAGQGPAETQFGAAKQTTMLVRAYRACGLGTQVSGFGTLLNDVTVTNLF
jgi:hypothetical protein